MIAGAFIAASILARRFEPMVREQAIRYLQERFHSDVQIQTLRITPPKVSTFNMLLRRGRGALVSVQATGVSMRFSRALPPLFTIGTLTFIVDLGTVLDKHKTVPFVTIRGMKITIPPKDQRPDLDTSASTGKPSQPLDVALERVRIQDAVLVLLPKDQSKKSLDFDIAQLDLKSVASNSAMKYDAALTIPMPPGTLHSTGDFGPWNGPEPGDTPLQGDYTFNNADLGVFQAIAGTLASTGKFDGTLDSVRALGRATIPNFRLKSVGNAIPLTTSFECLVDGTNGDTVLKPVQVRLGHTSFTTTGAVIKHEKEDKRGVRLKVTMPAGNITDLLRLTTKGPPFMEGTVAMMSTIGIPPLSGTVKEKLRLDGEFELTDGRFLRENIQDQIDQLSRRGQGQPKNQEIDDVFANMAGSFKLEDQIMTFRSLSFDVPGARVAMAGDYDLNDDTVDFHGTLKLQAKLSKTMTGWKRWVLKPVDPFFAKNGAGTFLRIQVEGSSHQPKFGLDHSKKSKEQEPDREAAASGRQTYNPSQSSARSPAASRAPWHSPGSQTTASEKESRSLENPDAPPSDRPARF